MKTPVELVPSLEPRPEPLKAESGPPPESTDLTPTVGANLRRLRVKKGLSLERLAKQSGVSRAMLGQIELGQSTPTINVLWKIAVALGVPFSGLISSGTASDAVVLPVAKSKVLMSHDGGFSSRALFPFEAPRNVELYELRIQPGATERADAHAPGTTENLVVNKGALQIEVGGHSYTLEEGDAITFDADRPHVYHNPSAGLSVVYLVMTYAETIG